jgi:integrase/recombinase XerC
LWMTSEKRLAPSTIRGYQGSLRLFSEFLSDARYGWLVACEKEFGTHPVPICHEWNTIARRPTSQTRTSGGIQTV